jgi:hypothetical protein
VPEETHINLSPFLSDVNSISVIWQVLVKLRSLSRYVTLGNTWRG